MLKATFIIRTLHTTIDSKYSTCEETICVGTVENIFTEFIKQNFKKQECQYGLFHESHERECAPQIQKYLARLTKYTLKLKVGSGDGVTRDLYENFSRQINSNAKDWPDVGNTGQLKKTCAHTHK